MRHGCKAGVLKETHLKMEQKLLNVGWKMGSAHLEPLSVTVPPLPEFKQWYISCVSPANAHVIVLALNSKCRVLLLASAKGTIRKCGRIIHARTLAENNGCDKSDTYGSEQCLKCD